jgi:hypothetical protein
MRLRYISYWNCLLYYILNLNRLGGIIVDVLVSSVVDHGFEPRASQTESYQNSY